MQDIYSKETIQAFQSRIHNLTSAATPQWGSMHVFAMLKHCTMNDQMLLREQIFRRMFLGRLFGRLALHTNIKDDAPLKRNSPTHPDLKIDEDGDVEAQKKLWISLLAKYPKKRPDDYEDFIHPFFGRMNAEEVSRFAFKHIDHHLRQFGV